MDQESSELNMTTAANRTLTTPFCNANSHNTSAFHLFLGVLAIEPSLTAKFKTNRRQSRWTLGPLVDFSVVALRVCPRESDRGTHA